MWRMIDGKCWPRRARLRNHGFARSAKEFGDRVLACKHWTLRAISRGRLADGSNGRAIEFIDSPMQRWTRAQERTSGNWITTVGRDLRTNLFGRCALTESCGRTWRRANVNRSRRLAAALGSLSAVAGGAVARPEPHNQYGDEQGGANMAC